MLGPISYHIAEATIDGRIRTARRGHERHQVVNPPEQGEQRALVRASLLVARRIDRFSKA